MKICQTRISRGTRQETDRIITVLKIQIPGYTGWYLCQAELINIDGLWRKKKKAGKPCDILHIVKLDDSRESAFLIQDIFPITEEYIEREYTFAGNHLMLTSENTAREIEKKARKVIGMLKRGIKFTPTQPDVMAILERLRERR